VPKSDGVGKRNRKERERERERESAMLRSCTVQCEGRENEYSLWWVLFYLLIRIPDTIVENRLMGESGPVILWYIILNLLEVFAPATTKVAFVTELLDVGFVGILETLIYHHTFFHKSSVDSNSSTEEFL